ncbi:MAG: D-alanine--D-alanine ligase [Rhodomicrobium sp.]|nr:MAG: D-alanine--D-alanine ligase [Rhodomicrobium sp.]
MSNEQRHVAVLLGGWSLEREVSLASGEACAKALEEAGYRVTKVDVTRDLAATLKALSPDVCFNALHGPFGEDGCVQGLLEILEIPYTHSGVLASSLAMDKNLAKKMMAAVGVPVALSKIARRGETALGHLMPPPYVVKPVADGSSFGIYIVGPEMKAPPGDKILSDGDEDDPMMVEEYVAGLELTCAVMGDRALDIIEIRPEGSHDFYDYEAKYAEGGSQHILPAEISSNIYQLIQKYSLEAHNALGCRGVSRADFRYDPETETLVCLEINTQPGMTATSLVPEIAERAGYSFNELVRWIVEDASCNR